MAKLPSRTKKKVGTRSAKTSPAPAAKSGRASAAAAKSRSRGPAAENQAATHRAPPVEPPSSGPEPAAPVPTSSTPPAEPAREALRTAAEEPVEKPVGKKQEALGPPAESEAGSSLKSAREPAGTGAQEVKEEPVGEEPEAVAPPAESETPTAAAAQPVAEPRAVTEPEPVGQQRATEVSQPVATPPTRPSEGLDESGPVAMPAQAESVHIEEPVPDEGPAEFPPAPSRPELFIVHISPEMAPVAKVGGLADVVFGLSQELAIRGNHVEIILPKYDNLRYDHIWELHEVFKDLWVPWYEGAIHCTVYFGFVHGRKCFFIEPHSGDNFFNRGSIYGFPDDILRFAFFSRAATEFLWKSGKHPDIIHCHDWQTALVPVMMYEIYQQLGMTHPRACLTIHNFKHQGVTGMEMLRATGLHNPGHFFDYNRLRDNHNQHALNLLKGGIVYSNFVTTVSPRYATETRDQDQGFGLEPTLHTHQMKYGGVVNGIDYDVWNPEVDNLIPVRFGLSNIDAKYDNKRALRHRLMLADNEKPIVGFIGRLDPQKGLELVRHGIFQCLERGAQFVLLGSSPDRAINADFWGLKGMLNDSPDCHLEIGFDEELSHLIYAGADMMLVPSLFEPCGLTQLIALRYGTIPIVRSVGGLADTVFDKDHSYRPLHERNGYVFENYDHAGLESALVRAIACYYEYPQDFRELIHNAMRTDYSWNRPGQDYMNIYDYIRNK
jgi:starch synthase